MDTSRYFRLSIRCDNGKVKKYLLHRLVAICFIPNPDGLAEVNHKDGDKLNNHVDNLEWVSRHQNQQHAFETGLNTNLGSKNGRAILSEQDALDIYQLLLDGLTENDIAKRFSVDKNSIKNIKYKKNWGHILKDLPDIQVKYKSKSISESTARWICERLASGLCVKDIMLQSTNDRITESIIWDIKRRKSFKYISEDFSW